MARDKVTYEWAVEECDEHDDIFNVDNADTLAEAIAWRERSLKSADETGVSKARIALLRISGNQEDGEQGRFYAYLRDDGTLPARMETADNYQDGPDVPQRFHAEAAAAAKQFA